MRTKQQQEEERSQALIIRQTGGAGGRNQFTSKNSNFAIDRWRQIGVVRGVEQAAGVISTLQLSSPAPAYNKNAISWRLSSDSEPPAQPLAIEMTPHKSLPYGKQPETKSPTSSIVAIHELSDDENCALWLEMLPLGTTASWVIARIRTGAVAAIHINKPTDEGQLYAAKIVFVTHVGAEKLLEYLRTAQGIQEFGGLVSATYNRNGFVRSQYLHRSRVIRIQGRAPYMTEGFWFSYLQGIVWLYGPNFYYQTSHSRQSTLPDGRIEVEIGFASVASQAFFVKKTIMADATFLGLVDVLWAEDPCGA